MKKDETIHDMVMDAIRSVPVVDIHTHIYDPALGPLLLWGIDELVTYHYLIAEVFRARPQMTYESFWAMPKKEQANLVWQELFVKRSPVSEACRGVLTVLNTLGLNAASNNLDELRGYFDTQDVRSHVDNVFKLAKVDHVYMTNDPLDEQERPTWEKGFDRDPRFLAVLRLDSAIINWPEGASRLSALGYKVDTSLSGATLDAVRSYLNDWCERMDAKYMAVSLPPDLAYPDTTSSLTTLLTKAVIPAAMERDIPVAMMIGVKKLVNPSLRLAGDSVGKADIDSLERMANDFPDVRFLITMLSRENMHELCIASRKFKNILPFGCWWFLNNPSLIREITAMRLETLGLTFIPQHSDARILDQLVYKWRHSRELIGSVFAEKYADMALAGRPPDKERVARDIARVLDGTLLENN